MAAELERELKATVQITPGTGGVYEVEDNGVLIFSKAQLGRFPQEGEIMNIVRSVDAGIPLNDAKEKASAPAPESNSLSARLGGWLSNLTGGSRD